MTTTKHLVLNGSRLLEMARVENVHQVSRKSQVSTQTVYKYLKNPEKVKSIDLSVLPRILMLGLEIPEEEMLSLTLREIFELVEDE